MISVQAPSNIAIVKYMGKKPEGRNVPENASLSMTLSQLQTRVSVLPSRQGEWVFTNSGQFSWTPKAIEKVSRFFKRCDEVLPEVFSRFKLSYQKPAAMQIQSENTFPAGVGIASSASSFAALTLAYAAASVSEPSLEDFKREFRENSFLKAALASLSREGSGSSCRSFSGPWVLWRECEVQEVVLNWPPLSDLVVVFDSKEKQVSSSQAHQRVKTSALWAKRTQNAEARLAQILNSKFEDACEIITEEALEMHELFHTSAPPFSYMNDQTKRFIDFYHSKIRSLVPAAFTLDAGPNPHLLVPTIDLEVWKTEIESHFEGAKIIVDSAGKGADFL